MEMFGSNMQPKVIKKQARGPWTCNALLKAETGAEGPAVYFNCGRDLGTENPAYLMQCRFCGNRRADA